MPIGLSVLGALGKMGKRVTDLALQDPELQLVSASVREIKEEMQSLFSADPYQALALCDVAIDFTSPAATESHLQAATLLKKPLVIGTTGHSEQEWKAIEEAAKSIPILYSPNFSLGVALCLEAIHRFAKALYGNCTIEITETHHIHKKDAPSGTALAFAKAVGQGKIVLNKKTEQKRDEIVICSIRAGEMIGEHVIVFECAHERIELKHTALGRDLFAEGALKAAKFLVKQPAGLYGLKDLL